MAAGQNIAMAIAEMKFEKRLAKLAAEREYRKAQKEREAKEK